MRNRKCGMLICRVACRLLILAPAILCTDFLNISHSAFPTPHFSLPIPHSPSPTPHSLLPTAHKIHVSVTNLEFNKPRQTVEIVIRVFTDDLENALGRRAKRVVKIDPATA